MIEEEIKRPIGSANVIVTMIILLQLHALLVVLLLTVAVKNQENKANIRAIDKELVNGTRIFAISKSRKINKNNTSGYIGVSYSKDKKKWVAQITFQRMNHLIGRFNTKRKAI